jgi:hypothetical protein
MHDQAFSMDIFAIEFNGTNPRSKLPQPLPSTSTCPLVNISKIQILLIRHITKRSRIPLPLPNHLLLL